MGCRSDKNPRLADGFWLARRLALKEQGREQTWYLARQAFCKPTAAGVTYRDLRWGILGMTGGERRSSSLGTRGIVRPYFVS
jgi:hypothetical protein